MASVNNDDSVAERDLEFGSIMSDRLRKRVVKQTQVITPDTDWRDTLPEKETLGNLVRWCLISYANPEQVVRSDCSIALYLM